MPKPESEIALLWSDQHRPHHDRRAVNLILDFVRQWERPFDQHIIIGDLADCGGVSHFNRRRFLTKIENQMGEGFDSCNEFLDELANASPDAKTIYIEGNHEYWLTQYMDSHPQLAGVLGLSRNLGLKQRGIQLVPYEEQRYRPYRLGKLQVVHGWYANQHHAAKTAQEATGSIVYGHTHDMQAASKKSQDGSRHMAWSIGHLMNERSKAARYLRQPTNWVRGFAIVEWNKQHFNITQIPLVDYQFFYDGFLWGRNKVVKRGKES